ncbi:hypothetical protein [Leifsonia poae]|uniref:hypothetical protein n=1 Tax=Leifsonia poae TaxID=110933 RepID=UPI003D671B84
MDEPVSVRIFIPDDIVMDGDVPQPIAGVVIPEMGVRLGRMWTADGRDETFEGVVEWRRADEPNHLFETAFATSRFKVLTQDAAKGHLPEVGDRVELRGTLSCVRSYEFQAFDLPDTRQSWRVAAVLAHDRNGYLIEADPIPPLSSPAHTLPTIR